MRGWLKRGGRGGHAHSGTRAPLSGSQACKAPSPPSRSAASLRASAVCWGGASHPRLFGDVFNPAWGDIRKPDQWGNSLDTDSGRFQSPNTTIAPSSIHTPEPTTRPLPQTTASFPQMVQFALWTHPPPRQQPLEVRLGRRTPRRLPSPPAPRPERKHVAHSPLQAPGTLSGGAPTPQLRAPGGKQGAGAGEVELRRDRSR